MLGEIHPCLSLSEGQVQSESVHFHAPCSVPREIHPEAALWPRKNPLWDLEWWSLLFDFGTSLSPQTTCLDSHIIDRTRNILWPVWTICSTWSVANWDCSQWAVIVFGAVIKLGLRAPRQLYQQSINHAGFLEEISLATAHCKLQLHLWLMS